MSPPLPSCSCLLSLSLTCKRTESVSSLSLSTTIGPPPPLAEQPSSDEVVDAAEDEEEEDEEGELEEAGAAPDTAAADGDQLWQP